MAVDMSTVKQIMHNNKEVTKIEDSLGNILWQKVVSKAYRELDYIYFSGTEYVGVSAYPIYNYTELSYELTTLVNRGFTLGVYYGPAGQTAKFFNCFDNYNNNITLRVNRTRTQTVNTATYSPVNTFRKLAMTVGSNSYTFQLFDSTNTSVYSTTKSAVPNTWNNLDLGVMSCHAIESDSTDHYTNMANGKVYKLLTRQTNSSGTILFEGVPCQRKSDNVCGLYDKVSNTFFPMQGTYVTTTAAGNTVNENPSWSPNA